MKVHGTKDVWITVPELVELTGNRLSAQSITVSCSTSRSKGNGTSWINIPDEADGRKIIISYKSIPDRTFDKYSLPDVKELREKIKESNALQKVECKQQQLDFANYALEDCINKAVKEEYFTYLPKYIKSCPNNRDKAKQLAKAHAVIQCCIDLKAGRSAHGYSVKELHQAYLKAPGIKISLTNEEKFRQKLVECSKGEINMLHKSAGTPPPQIVKLTAWHIAKMELFYKDQKQHTIKTISEMLYSECLKAGHVTVSESSVAGYFKKPEVKNRLAVYRNPSYFKRTVKASTRRSEADYAGDLYYADGSPIQIFCWNKTQTKQIRLNLFVVMDTASKKIVGFDLAESEDRFNWFSAIKMAFSMEMLLPYQLMTDQASVTKTAEYAALKSELEIRGCRLCTTKKGEGQQKADIERWFNTFQGFQRMVDGFIGEGIRSKRENGRIDVDFLASIQKEKGFYTYESMVTIIAQLIGIYNQKTENSRRSPNQVFNESPKSNMQKVDAADLAVLFWHHKTLKIKNSEVKFEIKKQVYYYEVYNHEIGLKINNTEVKVYYDENDPSNIHLFTTKGEYLCECRQKVEIKKAAANQTEADVLQIIKQSHHNDSMATIAKKITEAVIQKGLQMDEGLLNTLDPFTIHKDLYNNAESEAALAYIYNEKGIDRRNVAEYQPADTHKQIKSKLNKPTVQDRHAKRNMVPASLEVIKRP